MALATKTVWGDVLGRFRGDHPELVRGWFGDLHLVDLCGGVLTIEAPSLAEKKYLEAQCGRAFAAAALAVLGRFITINVVAPAAHRATQALQPLSAALDTTNPEFTFGSFVRAPCNDLALAAATAVAEEPGEHYNPLFVFGEPGTGKTHLLQGICDAAKKTHPESHPVYVRCRDFIDGYVNAFDHDELPRFRAHFREASLLAIDDIHDLAGNERSQEEFFHTFEALYKTGQQVVIASVRSPGDMPGITERLTTRFGLGLVAAVEHPSRETRISIVAARARARCLELGDGVADLLADRFSTSTPDLIAGLDKIDALARAQGARIDVAFAGRALEDDHELDVPIAAVLDAVARRFEVAIPDLLSRRRGRRVSFAREAGIFLARRLTRLSLEQVGEVFGGRNHLEVLEAAQAVQERTDEDSELSLLLDEIGAEAKNGVR